LRPFYKPPIYTASVVFGTAFTRPIYFPGHMRCSRTILYVLPLPLYSYQFPMDQTFNTPSDFTVYRNIIHIHYPLYVFVCVCMRVFICVCVRLIDISGGRQRTCNWISKISSPIHPFDCSPSLSHPLPTFGTHFNTITTTTPWSIDYVPRQCSVLRNSSGLPSYIVVFVPGDLLQRVPRLLQYVTCFVVNSSYIILYDIIWVPKLTSLTRAFFPNCIAIFDLFYSSLAV